MVSKKHGLLHPGYAPREVRQGKVPAITSDIYSFGVTFFVMLHHTFPTHEINTSKLDVILMRCCAEDEKQRYASFQEVRIALHAFQQQTGRKGVRKGCGWFLVLACLFLMIGFWSLQAWNRMLQLQYIKAIRSQEYRRAMDIKPSEVEPYQQMLAADSSMTDYQQKDHKSVLQESLLRLEEEIIFHKQEENSKIVYMFAMKCMEVNDREFYRKASSYFLRVKIKNQKEQSIVGNYQKVADLLSTSQPLHKSDIQRLKVMLMKCEQEMESLASPQDRCQHAVMLLRIYEYHSFQGDEDIYDASIRLAGKIKRWTSSHINLQLKVSESDALWKVMVNANYEKGMLACQKQEYERMENCFKESLSTLKNIAKQDDEDDLHGAAMYLSIFEYGIEDSEKYQHMSILQNALQYCMEGLEKNPENIAIQQLYSIIEHKQALWR